MARFSSISDFYCTKCGNKGIPVVRKNGKKKEAGHLKKLYCIYCNQETNHVEIRDDEKYTYNDFKIEFDNGNFIDGKRVLTYKQLQAKLRGDDINERGKG